MKYDFMGRRGRGRTLVSPYPNYQSQQKSMSVFCQNIIVSCYMYQMSFVCSRHQKKKKWSSDITCISNTFIHLQIVNRTTRLYNRGACTYTDTTAHQLEILRRTFKASVTGTACFFLPKKRYIFSLMAKMVKLALEDGTQAMLSFLLETHSGTVAQSASMSIQGRSWFKS